MALAVPRVSVAGCHAPVSSQLLALTALASPHRTHIVIIIIVVIVILLLLVLNEVPPRPSFPSPLAQSTWGGYVPARNDGKHRGCRRCLVRRKLRRWNGSKPPPVTAGEITSVKRQPPAAPHLSCAGRGREMAAGERRCGRRHEGARRAWLSSGLRPPSSAEPGGWQRPVGACRSLPAARAGGAGRARPRMEAHGRFATAVVNPVQTDPPRFSDPPPVARLFAPELSVSFVFYLLLRTGTRRFFALVSPREGVADAARCGKGVSPPWLVGLRVKSDFLCVTVFLPSRGWHTGVSQRVEIWPGLNDEENVIGPCQKLGSFLTKKTGTAFPGRENVSSYPFASLSSWVVGWG